MVQTVRTRSMDAPKKSSTRGIFRAPSLPGRVAKDVAKPPSSPIGAALRRGAKDVERWLRSPKNSKLYKYEDRDFDDVMSPTRKGVAFGGAPVDEHKAEWVSFLRRLGQEKVSEDEAVAAYRTLDNGRFSQKTLKQELMKHGIPTNAVKRLPFGPVNVFEFITAYA